MNKFPRKIKWVVESNCNLNCSHCILGQKNLGNTLDLEERKKILEFLAEKGCLDIILMSKEPLFSKDIVEFLHYIRLLKMRITVISNGTLITKEIAEELLNGYCHNLIISLEGLDEKTNDTIRGAGSFNKTIHGIETVYEMSKSKNKSLPVILQMCLTPSNYKEIFDNIHGFILKHKNISKVNFGPVYQSGNANSNPELSFEYKEYKGIAHDFIKKCPTSLASIEFKDIMPFEKIFFNLVYDRNYYVAPPNCTLCSNGISLLPDGKMCRCPLLLDTSIIPNEELILKDIRLFDFENMNLNKKYFPIKDGFCSECPFSKECYICLFNTNNFKICHEISDTCEKFYNYLKQIIKYICNNKLQFKLKNGLSMKIIGKHISIVDKNGTIFEIDMNCKKLEVNEERYVFFRDTSIDEELLTKLMLYDLIRIEKNTHFWTEIALKDFLN